MKSTLYTLHPDFDAFSFLEPLPGKLILLRDIVALKTESGLFVPVSASVPQTRATVIAVGPPPLHPHSGLPVPLHPSLIRGARVLCSPYIGHSIAWDGPSGAKYTLEIVTPDELTAIIHDREVNS